MAFSRLHLSIATIFVSIVLIFNVYSIIINQRDNNIENKRINDCTSPIQRSISSPKNNNIEENIQTNTQINNLNNLNYNNNNNNATKLVVLGMHRSGTSMTTGLLATCFNIYTGKPLLASNSENEKGFFERTELVAMNSVMLSEHRKSQEGMESTGVFRCDQFTNPSASGSQTSILLDFSFRRFVEELNQQKIWIIKDPRLCLTYGFYHKWIKDPIFIIPVRHPMEVAQSLARRGGYTLEAYLNMWYHYVMNSLRFSIGHKRIIFFQDEVLENPQGFALDIYKQLQDMNANLDIISHDNVQQCAENWVNQNLVHHKNQDKGQNNGNKINERVEQATDKYTILWNNLKSREAEKWTLKDLPVEYQQPPYDCL